MFVVRLASRSNVRSPALTKTVSLKDGLTYGQKCTHGWFSGISTSAVIFDKETHLGVDYLKDGTDAVLSADEEYPNWLWELSKTKQSLRELSPQSPSYRRILRKKQRREENERRKMKRF